MIKATGIKNGRKMIVEYDHGKMLFNGEQNEILAMELQVEIDRCYDIGQYYPEPEEPINIYNVLELYFFDEYAESVEKNEKIKMKMGFFGRIEEFFTGIVYKLTGWQPMPQ